MKSYLRLFLILVFFGYVFNTAQAENPEDMTQVSRAVWKLAHPDGSHGTVFFITPKLFVTSFQFLTGFGEQYKNRSFEEMYLEQKDRALLIKGIHNVSAADDLVVGEIRRSVNRYVNLSARDSSEILEDSGSFFPFGYPKIVRKNLIGKYGITDLGDSYSLAVNETLLGYYMEGRPTSPTAFNILDHSVSFFVLGGLMGAPVTRHKEVIGIVAGGKNNMLEVTKVRQLEKLRQKPKLDCSKLSSCIQQEIANLQTRAKIGEPSAKKALARMLYYGIGMKQDRERAFKLRLELANKDYPSEQLQSLNPKYLANLRVRYARVQYEVADELYRRGKVQEAFKRYEIAAMKGDPQAEYVVASMLSHGIGVEIDVGGERAFDLMSSSAKKGYAPAQLGLFVLSLNRKNYTRAVNELEESANQGYYSAQVYLHRMKSEAKQYTDTVKDKPRSIGFTCRERFKDMFLRFR